MSIKEGGRYMVLEVKGLSFFLKSSCQPTETDLKGATTFHATALLVVWVKIPMEILMRTQGEDTQARGKPREWRIQQNKDSTRQPNVLLPHLCMEIFSSIWSPFFGLKSHLAQSPLGKIQHEIVCLQYNQLVVWPPHWLMQGNFPSISKSPLQPVISHLCFGA